MTHNPWTIVGTKTIYQNPWIKVREDNVIRPDGSPGIYGVVEAHKATGVVAINEKNEIYLVGQYRYPTEEYSWEIVEGGAKTNESPLDAVKRELAEEAGLEATNWEQLGDEIHLSNCYSNERAYLFLARGLKEVPKNPDVTEVLEVKTMPFSEALKMVRSGEIKDSMSIIAILRAEQYLS